MLVPVLLACSIGGCAVGPDFHHPVLQAAEEPGDAWPAATTSSSKVSGGNAQHLVIGRDIPGDWWALFRSPAITTLVATALRDSPTIEAADAALRQAQELELAQAGTLFPTITGTVGRTRQEEPLTLEGTQQAALLFSDYGARLDLSYTLDFWGGLRRAVEQSGAQVDYQRFQLEAACLALSAGVASAAILAASLQGQIDAQAQLIGFEQKQLDTVRQQFELGGATSTDVATQQAQVAQKSVVL